MTSCSSSFSSSRGMEKHNYLLPQMASADVEINKKTVVLDLDETLVRVIEERIPGRSVFTVDIQYGKEMYKQYLLKRPGVDELLQGLAKSRAYEIVVFSAANKEYVNAVVDSLLLQLPPIEGIDNNMNIIPPTHRLWRDMCTDFQFPGNKTRIVKDLSLLGRDLKKVIIVDDSPRSFHLQPHNGMHIEPWTGDVEDGWLSHLLLFFKEIAKSTDDVKDLIPQFFAKLRAKYSA